MRWFIMLTIKCAKCKTKLMKYKKIGQGKVLRCWESKIQRFYDGEIIEDQLVCGSCGNIIGDIESSNKGNCIKMNSDSFTYTGTKIDK